jgi:acetyl-CoA carboxylase biotin carboxyl carrier protein
MTDDRAQDSAPEAAPDRRRDHAAIDRLADDLLPRLIGRLGSSGLGEIEVRENGWRVRLRRPVAVARAAEPRGDRAERAARPGTQHHLAGDVRPRDGHATRPGAVEGNGKGPVPSIPVRRELVATSPAVGVFQPRSDVRAGMRVRAGDRLGVVDLLGVPQEVIAPADGVVTETLVGPGEGVEYGQDLILIDPATASRPSASLDDEAGA